jgi:hypothetical protein
MADDKKKNPSDQTTEDQQKGGEATATDQNVDVTDVAEEDTFMEEEDIKDVDEEEKP